MLVQKNAAKKWFLRYIICMYEALSNKLHHKSL